MGEIGIGHPAGRRAVELEVALIVLAARQRNQSLVTCFLPHRGADIADRNTHTAVVGGIWPGRMKHMPKVQRGLSRLKYDVDIIALVDVDHELKIVASDQMMTTCLSDAICWSMGESQICALTCCL